MRTFDTICKFVGGAGALMVALGFIYIAFVMTFGIYRLPPPPRMMFAGMGLTLSAMLSYGAVHIIRGDL